MFIVLNGPLGIGKSTLAEALVERIDRCVMLDGDHLIATNPSPVDDIAYLHSVIKLLVAHHRRFGYQHFVINHIWRTSAELSELHRNLIEIDPSADVRCFLLSAPLEENLRRIELRQAARAIDERKFEQRTVMEEREALFSSPDVALGEHFDVSAEPADLVPRLLVRLGLT